MNDATAAEERTKRFADAVRSFADAPPKRFAVLLPHRDGITELRQKGASFGMIRELLAMAGIEVAADTVRRFYREVIEEPKIGGKRTQKRERTFTPPSLESSAPAAAAPLSSAAPVISTPAEMPRNRGPRVADPRNL